MATFVWLEEEMQMKEELKSAAMGCGVLYINTDGIVVMLLSLVGSLESISHTLVCSLQIYYCTLIPKMFQELKCSIAPVAILDGDLGQFYSSILTVMELNQDCLTVALTALTFSESAIQVMLE